MTTRNLTKLIGTSESATIEWKPPLSQMKDIVESVTAFANTEGGKLFVGVSRDGKVCGVTVGKDTVETLSNKLAQHAEPKFEEAGGSFVVTFAGSKFSEDNLSSMGLNERQIQAVQLVKEKGTISLMDLKEIFAGVTRKTLYRDLQILVEKGILKAQGATKGRRYGF